MIPENPYILFSWLNLKLRDEYESFEELCRSLDADQTEIAEKMRSIGFDYDAERNCFR